jgi:hypothetical protein
VFVEDTDDSETTAGGTDEVPGDDSLVSELKQPLILIVFASESAFGDNFINCAFIDMSNTIELPET